jgi:hypothetical protein
MSPSLEVFESFSWSREKHHHLRALEGDHKNAAIVTGVLARTAAAEVEAAASAV